MQVFGLPGHLIGNLAGRRVLEPKFADEFGLQESVQSFDAALAAEAAFLDATERRLGCGGAAPLFSTPVDVVRPPLPGPERAPGIFMFEISRHLQCLELTPS